MKWKMDLFNFEAKFGLVSPPLNITTVAIPFNWSNILSFKSGIQIKIQQNWICNLTIAYYIKLKIMSRTEI